MQSYPVPPTYRPDQPNGAAPPRPAAAAAAGAAAAARPGAGARAPGAPGFAPQELAPGFAPPQPPPPPVPRPEDLLLPDRAPVTAEPATWGWRGRMNRVSGGLIKAARRGGGAGDPPVDQRPPARLLPADDRGRRPAEGRGGQDADHDLPVRGVRRLPRRLRRRLGRQRDARHAGRSGEQPRQPARDGVGPALRPVRLRAPRRPGRRPELLRPPAAGRALRRAGVRRQPRQHGADRRGRVPPAAPRAAALLPDDRHRHRQQRALAELAGRGQRRRPRRRGVHLSARRRLQRVVGARPPHPDRPRRPRAERGHRADRRRPVHRQDACAPS